MKKIAKRGQRKGRSYTPKPKQARIIARHLSGQSDREIARQESVSRGTVYRVRAQAGNLMLVQSYRDMILDLVPEAVRGLRKLIRKVDRQAIIETLYGSRVLMHRQEVEAVQPFVQDDGDLKVDFFGKYHRWPTDEELAKFAKTVPVKLLIHGELE